MSLQKGKKNLFKNYMILAGIYIGVIILVLYLVSWYKTYQDYQKETPVLRNTLFEVNQEEIEHYLQENPSCLIYMCDATSDRCRDFEVAFKKEILKKQWHDDITYLNLSLVQNKEYYLSSFVDQYAMSDFSINKVPALVAIEDGKIVSTISGINGSDMTINEAKQFIEDYQFEY